MVEPRTISLLIALVCVVGPWFMPHEYTTIYADYVRTPPSLRPYPQARHDRDARSTDAVSACASTSRSGRQDGERVTATVTATKPIDARVVALFRPLRCLRRHADREQVAPTACEVTMSASVKQQYFLFGTDTNGRDLLSRTLIAGRISLAIGLLASVVALVIGVLYGATAGFLGGRVDDVMMRIVDMLYSLPFIFFVILLVVFFGRNFILMFLAIGAVEWLDMARIVRGQTLSIKRQEFVAGGRGHGRRPARHPAPPHHPQHLGPVVVFMTLLVPQVILLESFLSFLGLGVQEPMTSWGVLISEGAKNIGSATGC